MSHEMEPIADLTGFELFSEAKDLGEIEEILLHPSCDYYLVDTRHWTFGTKRLLPVGVVVAEDQSARRAGVTIDPEIIRSAPDFDPFRLTTAEYWSRLQKHYCA